MSAALQGMRILDLSQYEAGPSCTQALALLGAEVVKVERPGVGDPGRAGFHTQAGDSDYFLAWNSNKRSVALALDQPEGRQLLLRLLARFDVLVENFGPGVTEKLALDAPTIRAAHPHLIYASVKGFGSSGPLADLKCFDAVAQAASGALSLTGSDDGPPMRMGATLGDCGAGMQLALAICAAYIQRQRTGVGQCIELSMQEALTYYLRTALAIGSDQGRRAAPRSGNRMGALVDLFPCAPGGPNDFVYIMAVAPRMWDAICVAIDRPDLKQDPRFATPADRSENVAQLHAEIGSWTQQRDKFSAMRQLSSNGVPASAVYDTADLYREPHLVERGFVHQLEHPERGSIRLLGFAPRLDDSQVELQPAPLLGADTAAVLGDELGLEAEDLADLAARGIVSGARCASS
jgi:formyl-CoA transferase